MMWLEKLKPKSRLTSAQMRIRHATCRVMLCIAGCAMVGLYLAPSATAAEEVAETPGLAVGSKAPSFELMDANGAKQSLDSLLKKHKAVALVFHRSAGW